MAVIFINKLDKDGKATEETTGLCLECAKKQGIDPLQNIMKEMANLSPDDIDQMSNQLDSMFGDQMDFENNEDNESSSPFGNFANLMSFGKKKKPDEEKTTE